MQPAQAGPRALLPCRSPASKWTRPRKSRGRASSRDAAKEFRVWWSPSWARGLVQSHASGQKVSREVVLRGFDLTCLPPSELSRSSVLLVNSAEALKARMSKFQCPFRKLVAELNRLEDRLFLPNVTIRSVFVDQLIGLGARVVAGSSNGSRRCAVIAPPRSIRRTDLL